MSYITNRKQQLVCLPFILNLPSHAFNNLGVSPLIKRESFSVVRAHQLGPTASSLGQVGRCFKPAHGQDQVPGQACQAPIKFVPCVLSVSYAGRSRLASICATPQHSIKGTECCIYNSHILHIQVHSFRISSEALLHHVDMLTQTRLTQTPTDAAMAPTLRVIYFGMRCH